MKTIGTKVGWSVMLFLALGITLISSRYLTLDPAVYFPEQRVVYETNPAGILGHVAGALLALTIGPFQFLPAMRRQRWIRLHRWLGRIYLGGVAVGGLFGFYMAWLAYGGPISRLGFASLSLLWLGTGIMAYRAIRARDIQAHRRWMLRNYALTFAAVTLRLWQPLLAVAGIDFPTAYRTVAWLCWTLNLAVIEWWIQSQFASGRHRQPEMTHS